jgi:flagellar hook-length control protein FliK
MVAALAHGGENDVPGSMVAALAHRGENDGPGSPVAALARSGADGVPPSAVARRGDGDGPGSPRAALAQGAAGAAPPPADRGGLSAGRRPSTAQPARAGQVSTSAVIDADRFLTAGVAAAEVPVGASAEPLSAPSRRLSGATTEVSVLGLHTAGNSSARQAEAVAAPSDAAPPATLPAVADQIVSAVVPLHGRGDGRHEVTLELRPGDLGAIRVEVAVEHQTVHVTLHAVEPATGRLLSAALPELRSALAEAGLTAGHVGVGPDGGGGAGQRRPATGDGAAERSRAGAGHRGGPQNTDPVRTVRPATAGRLDLFL